MNIFGGIFNNEFGKLASLKTKSDSVSAELWVIFSSLLEAGFTREESLELTKTILQSMVISGAKGA